MWSVSLPGTDVILVLGPEPALRWRAFSDQIVGICDRFGVTMAVSLGALLADVPHSRPVQLIGTATDDTLIERFELQRSQYEGPTGIVGVFMMRCTERAWPPHHCGPPFPAMHRKFLAQGSDGSQSSVRAR